MGTTTSIWDLYLDPDDASIVLDTIVVLERNRAIREPLPLGDAARLLGRLRTVARISSEEASAWHREAYERGLEADVDGGRWGSPEAAHRMEHVALQLAESSSLIAAAALAAADDLAPRLSEPTDDAVQAATEATLQEARDLLARYDRDQLSGNS